MAAPTPALFFTRAMFARREAPAVSWLTRFSKKGVTAAPLMSGRDHSRNTLATQWQHINQQQISNT
jgi:hypothetical protein